MALQGSRMAFIVCVRGFSRAVRRLLREGSAGLPGFLRRIDGYLYGNMRELNLTLRPRTAVTGALPADQAEEGTPCF